MKSIFEMFIYRCPNMAVQEAEENNESQDEDTEDTAPDLVCFFLISLKCFREKKILTLKDMGSFRLM